MAHEQQPEQAQPHPTGDYGYDMAHDFEPPSTPPRASQQGGRAPVYVSTETSDPDEDYSYDLAHDVPPQQPG